MTCRIADFRNKQVVCVKNGCVLGYVSDIEFNTETGKMEAIVIFGKLKLLGLLGRDDDIVISWDEIEVIGQETVLIKSDPTPFVKTFKPKKWRFGF